jgi:hypothetical protein
VLWLCRPDFGAVLSELLGMRAADARRTPPIHLLLRPLQHELEDKDDAFAEAGGRHCEVAASFQWVH